MANIFHGRTKVVRDEVQCLRIIRHFCVEACEVEPVEDILLFDLAEVLVSFGRKKPGNPLQCLLAFESLERQQGVLS